MPQDLFPDPGPDDAEPGGFPPVGDAPGPEQGLYVCLPAEHLTLAGFCQGGASDTMAPGPLLATVVHPASHHLAATHPARLTQVPDLRAPADVMVPVTAPAAPVPATARAQLPGRAWPRWSPSPSP